MIFPLPSSKAQNCRVGSIGSDALELVLIAAFLMGSVLPAVANGPVGGAAVQAVAAPVISKIDPPNWWATLPKPMLLVRGENLGGANFSLSDARLKVERKNISANGHWAELWLSASPASAESVTLKVSTEAGSASAAYRFEAPVAGPDRYAGFSAADVLYLIMTDRFADGDLTNDGPAGNEAESSADAQAERGKVRGWHGGDLKGITQHLDYLQQLGVTTVWMTPVYANQGETDSYHGYGATDMFAVDPHYGTLADLRGLGTELHRRHMKLVLDTVPNHVGPANPWIDDPPDPAWLHGSKASHLASQGDFLSLVNPHAPFRDQQALLQGWFADVLADLNQENQATSDYLTENAVWWIEQTGADGLRIDTFPYVGRQFWHDFHAAVHGIFPRLTTVGEVFNCDATVTSFFAGGRVEQGIDTGLDTPFDFPSYCALRDVFLQGQPMTRLADVWRQDSLYPHAERLVPFLGNHDTSRFPGLTSPELTRVAFAVLLTMRGMPEIYSGDEIGMTGGDDPDNRHDFPGGWPDQPQSAFTSPTPDQAAMHDWVRQLLGLRTRYPALETGGMQMLVANNDELAYARISDGGQKVVVVLNRSHDPNSIALKLAGTALEGSAAPKTVLGTADVNWAGDATTVNVPPTSAWVGVIP